MHDRLMNDRRQAFRILTIVDIVTRECLALEVAPGFKSESVCNVLSRIVAKRGAPTAIRCDQGTEFTAEALDQWAYNNKVELDFSRPGKPTDNSFVESFNSTVRKELLNTNWFDSLESARRHARSWRTEYNEFRPHRSLSGIGKRGSRSEKITVSGGLVNGAVPKSYPKQDSQFQTAL